MSPAGIQDEDGARHAGECRRYYELTWIQTYCPTWDGSPDAITGVRHRSTYGVTCERTACLPKLASLPGNRVDGRPVPRIRCRSRRPPGVRWRGFPGEHAVAEFGESEGQGSARIG